MHGTSRSQLAREPTTVRAGDAVFAHGNRGDRCYMIAAGEAEVIADGQVLARLGPRDAVDVTALLRGVPHTTTVKARTDLSLYALHRRHLLSAVTGTGASTTNADIDLDHGLRRAAPHVPASLAWT